MNDDHQAGPDRLPPPLLPAAAPASRPPRILTLGWVRSAAPALPPRPRYGLALLLFGLTFFCTTTLGPVLCAWSRNGLPPDLVPLLTPDLVARVWGDSALLRLGLSFSLPVLAILLIHEMGHYIACRHYRLPSTLPYFLPLPAVLGTLGAFIRIRVPMRSKRELFDVGIAGPLAGFAALLPFLLIGIAKSQPAPLRLEPGASLLVPGQCLAMELATRYFHGRLAEGMVLHLHPFALAAWFGLLATAINLLPLGQLDGGHILYAVAGRWQRRLALPLWVALALAGVLWGGWVLWCVIVFMMGLYHPPVVDETIPLDPRRRALAGVALLILALSFVPRGATEPVAGEPAPPPASRGAPAVALELPAPAPGLPTGGNPPTVSFRERS
ncbi:MAG TPA: site-2 protease family protein [Thermoanaerobaculia bacterium]|nr:site-2 protease family protein [Thermoanaerobaculia bacterium]